MPVGRKFAAFADEIAEFLLSVIQHWRGALTGSVVLGVGLTAYQLVTAKPIQLQSYVWAILGGLPIAVFLAWVEQFRRAEDAVRVHGGDSHVSYPLFMKTREQLRAELKGT